MLKDLFALAPKEVGLKEWLSKLWFERPFLVFLFKTSFQLLCEIIFLPLVLAIYLPQLFYRFISLFYCRLALRKLLLEREILLLKSTSGKEMLEKVEHK